MHNLNDCVQYLAGSPGFTQGLMKSAGEAGYDRTGRTVFGNISVLIGILVMIVEHSGNQCSIFLSVFRIAILIRPNRVSRSESSNCNRFPFFLRIIQQGDKALSCKWEGGVSPASSANVG